jgi:hypothetical protein
MLKKEQTDICTVLLAIMAGYSVKFISGSERVRVAEFVVIHGIEDKL